MILPRDLPRLKSLRFAGHNEVVGAHPDPTEDAAIASFVFSRLASALCAGVPVFTVAIFATCSVRAHANIRARRLLAKEVFPEEVVTENVVGVV